MTTTGFMDKRLAEFLYLLGSYQGRRRSGTRAEEKFLLNINDLHCSREDSGADPHHLARRLQWMNRPDAVHPLAGAA
ncbi:hypothetical protein [Variovorax paradoxus]|uniref:hypothetical protein n=1 Tax=Variovorax paradoxus TaxID=34073 RepID=UPI002861F53F|nr:hypothetical protein [Variovorax paradoxus]MDR6450961.1 hypothetical protein [Variovorax paradoxus]